MSDADRLQEIRRRWGVGRIGPHSLDTEAQDYADVLWLVDALEVALAAPTPCPTCDGAGIVDTSPPGVEAAPWLATDTDCPRCDGCGVVDEENQ